MTGWVAACPKDHLAEVNSALEGQGFGPNNFSLPLPGAVAADWVVLHCWRHQAFRYAVEALASAHNIIVSGDGETPPDRVAFVADALGIPWPPAADWMDSLPMRDDEREFDGQVWRSTMDGNPYRPPHGWELVSAPPAVQPWAASGFYTQGEVVTDAEGVRRWALQTESETAAVDREPWQAYMWAVWQEVTP